MAWWHCSKPGCSSWELKRGVSNDDGAAQCAANCTANPTCAGWSMIKVTPTSGQRGKSPLCQTFPGSALATAAPFYRADPNFICGSKQQLQPNPPTPRPAPPKPHPDGLPPSRACVGVVAANGSTTRFCAGAAETPVHLRYYAVSTSSAGWELVLGARPSFTLTGTFAVGPAAVPGAAIGAQASEFIFELVSANCSDPPAAPRRLLSHHPHSPPLSHHSHTPHHPSPSPPIIIIPIIFIE